MVALELVKIIKNPKTKGYAKGEAISSFFRIIERGHSDKKMAQQLHETRERILRVREWKTFATNRKSF